MKFEELKRNVKAIISNDSNYSPLEEKEVDKIKSYGKAYFMFEEEVGDTPKDFMVIEDKIQLERLYDYLIAGYEKDDVSRTSFCNVKHSNGRQCTGCTEEGKR